MKIFRIPLIAMLLGVLVVVSCSDDDDTSYYYLDGSITLVFPEYVNPGYTKTFSLDSLATVTADDDGDVGYYWTDPHTGDRDTLRTDDGVTNSDTFTVTVYDTLATETLTLTAYRSGYVSTSGTAEFTIVRTGLNGDSSITNFDIADNDKTFTDPRDNTVYYYTTIRSTDWMRQNLAWAGDSDTGVVGVAYYDCDAMSTIFGRYYTWEEAQTACPEGWSLPSNEEWARVAEIYGANNDADYELKELAGDLMEVLYFNGTRMWEYWREVNVTNAARFSAMPVGWAQKDGDEYVFSDLYNRACFWTSDKYNEEYGLMRYIVEYYDTVYFGYMDKDDIALSVRCIRNSSSVIEM